jgi:hypothetical protein
MSKTSIEWRQERAAKIAQARALVDKADGENRDFTDEERQQYVALMGADNKSGEIAQLAQTIQAREELEKMETELREPVSPAFKPDGKTQPKLMKRSEFDALDQMDRAAYIKDGGTVED